MTDDTRPHNVRRRLLQMSALAGVGGLGYAAGRLGGSGETSLRSGVDVARLPRVLPASVKGNTASAAPSAAGPARRPPNILLIVTDQERASVPAALPLPAHEWLARHGTVFERWHVNTTPCSPSRSNLYFGQHSQHTRIIANLGVYPENSLPRDMPSLGHYLRANGYETAYKGKWHLSHLHARHELTYGHYPNSEHALEAFGFSDFNFDGDPHGSTWTGFKVDAQIAAQSADWIRSQAGSSKTAASGGKPWFLAVNLVNPHDVMYYATGAAQVASRKHKDYLAPLAAPPDSPLYRQQWAFDLPSNRGDDLSRKPWAHANYQVFCDMAYGQVPDDEGSWRAYQNYYFNCIRDADQHAMTVLKALEDSGQLRNTIVVFTSDHGEMAGAHGLRQKGPFMYDENTRVPMYIVHPDAAGGRRTQALGSAVDLIPTLLALAGADAKEIRQAYPALAGVSVAATVADSHARTPRDERGILFNYDTTHYLDSDFIERLVERGIVSDRWLPLRAVLSGMRPLPRLDRPALFRGLHEGRYKFARYFAAAKHHRPDNWQTLIDNNQLELYDLQQDPREMRNLAHDPAQVDSATKLLIERLNHRLNELVKEEVGTDLGDELPGPAFMKRL